MKARYGKAVFPIALAVAIAAVPAPAGLDQHAWYFFGIFVAVILTLILEPIPPAAAGFVGVFLIASLGLAGSSPAESAKWALSGFSNTTVWLIFGAFIFAMGYEKTGLGRRLGLLLVRAFGKKTLGLGYAITLADLCLAPFIPSNTARSGGTIYPIVRSLPALYGSFPGDTSRRVGSYVMWVSFAATCITSSMFITSLAPNLLAVEIAKKTVAVNIGWTDWFLGFAPVGFLLILILPYLAFKIFPPDMETGHEAQAWATEELTRMGRITKQEMLMASLASLALIMWIFGADKIDATTVAGLVISLMVVTSVVTWDEILTNKQAWNVLIGFSSLVALADGLNKVGFMTWLAARSATLLAGRSPIAAMLILVTLFFVVHYMFASLTAHTTAILPVVLVTGSTVPGIPMRPFVMLLCFSIGIMGVLTPYATGPAPVYFGSGFISRKEFWTLGLVFGAIFLLALLGIGTPYLLSSRP